LIDLLTATITGRNLTTATALSKLCGIEPTLETLARHMETMKALSASGDFDRKAEEEMFLGNAGFGSLLQLLSQQLYVFVLDPKLFRMARSWNLVAVGVNRILSAAVSHKLELTKTTAKVAAAAASVAFTLVEGARNFGLLQQEAEHHLALIDGAESVLSSAVLISVSKDLVKSHPAFVSACVALADLLRPGSVGLGIVGGQGSSPYHGMSHQATEAGEDSEAAGDDPFGSIHVGLQWQRSTTLAGLSQAFTLPEEATLSPLMSQFEGDDPISMRRYFWEALASNPQLNSAISLRRFALVECLENAGNRTGPGAAGTVPGADGRGSVKIEWLDIVARMVEYVKMHNFDKDQSGCLRVFRVLQNYLLKSRSEDDGSERDPIDLKEQRRVEYYAKQDKLAKCGVVEIVLTAIATHSPNGPEGALAEGAIDVLMELHNGIGSGEVQKAVRTAIDKDPDNTFLLHVKERFAGHLVCIEERKEAVSAVAFEDMSSEQRDGFRNCAKTFILLKLLCEGHHREAQDVLREQGQKSAAVNLIDTSVCFLSAQVEGRSMLVKMEETEVELLCINVDFLIECMQGPCPGNQEFVVQADGFVANMERIIQGEFHKRVSSTLVLHVKEACLTLLVACLEGRRNRVVHEKLAAGLEPEMLDMLKSNFVQTLAESRKSPYLSKSEFFRREHLTREALASLVSVTDGLVPVSSEFAVKVREVQQAKSALKDEEQEAPVEVAVVEVLWNDRIETAVFPIPTTCSFLTDSTKENFYLNCDLSNQEKRMKQLLSEAPAFDAEMAHVYELCSEKPFSGSYRFLRKHLAFIKWGMYGTVVMLNLNCVMAAYGTDSDDGYSTLVRLPKDAGFRGSLLISLALAILNFFGYVLIMAFSTVTEVPSIATPLWLTMSLFWAGAFFFFTISIFFSRFS
jgi:hypothetical protein